MSRRVAQRAAAGTWDLDAGLQVVRLLAAHPTNPGPSAPIELKLSENPQFQDRPGACKLIETAAGRGDPSMAPRLSECRAT